MLMQENIVSWANVEFYEVILWLWGRYAFLCYDKVFYLPKMAKNEIKFITLNIV
jgi:hypothetical protein